MIKENLLKALASIVVLILAMGALGVWFEQELVIATNWVVDRIGVAGLCLILFVTDTLVTPLSPDILLVVIANSHLAERWPRYVLILGIVSVGAGLVGWGIGRWLGHFGFAQSVLSRFDDEERRFVRKYGFWAIALGAITPLPFSVTCWTAGFMGVRGSTVLAASVLFRIPRIAIYYLLIASAGTLFG